jgi:hypothetical protein
MAQPLPRSQVVGLSGLTRLYMGRISSPDGSSGRRASERSDGEGLGSRRYGA